MSERLEIIKFLRNSEKTVAPGMQPSELISRKDVDWLINRVEELEKQKNERTQLLNAEVARNVRYKKVLDKIVNHAGKGIDIDYELWKMAKRALEE